MLHTEVVGSTSSRDKLLVFQFQFYVTFGKSFNFSDPLYKVGMTKIPPLGFMKSLVMQLLVFTEARTFHLYP